MPNRKRKGTGKRKGSRPTDKRQLLTTKDVGVQQKEAIPTTSQTENNHPYTEPTSTGMTERVETKMPIIHRPITKKEQTVKLALDHHQAPTEELRIVLIGKTGVGKSKTGNSIIGRNGDIFPFGCEPNSITKFCIWKTTNRFGKKIDVVDTPGVFEIKTDNNDIQKEIARCIGLTSPGPHAIMLCVRMGRFAAEDQNTIEHFLKYFGQELLKFTIVVFTHVDQWELDQEDAKEHNPQKDYLTADQFIKNLNPELKEFIESCGNRYLFFNNRLKGTEQDEMVGNMVQMIEQLVHTNNRKCFINENFIKVEEALRMEIEITKKTRDEVKSSSKFFEIISAIITFLKNKIWFK